MKQRIGLRTYRYEFKTQKAMECALDKLRSKGIIEIIYIDNAYGFDFTMNRIA